MPVSGRKNGILPLFLKSPKILTGLCLTCRRVSSAAAGRADRLQLFPQRQGTSPVRSMLAEGEGNMVRRK